MAAAAGRIALQYGPRLLSVIGATHLIGSLFDSSTSQPQESQQQQPYASVYPQTGDHNAVQYHPSFMSQLESWMVPISLGIGGLFLWNQFYRR